MTRTIGLICGSLRENSYNRIIAHSLTDMVDSYQFRWIEINDLPLFNEDLEISGIPETVTSFKSAIQDVDGIIIVSPGYHGSISGLVKNALDTLELTAKDEFPYFHGRPVGVIVTAYGWQATGSTLLALRSIVHAMRGWPTPFGAALNSTAGLFDEAGACRDRKDAWALNTVAEQVMDFAQMRMRS